MSILAETSSSLEQIKLVLEKELPMYREAFCDRTCFIMACLSELVYLKFNKPILDPNDKELVKKVSNLLVDESKLLNLYKLLELLSYNHEEEKEKLKKELDILDFQIDKLFNKEGTQAMIVSTSKFYALVFRGTEATSIADIKSDLKAKQTKCELGGKIHTGFKEAFELVQKEIQDYIDENLKDKPLLITGHSLGGALATVATKSLKYDKIAACYTFGSPRVGDEIWMLGIKAPVYRIVNSADPVTMLPFGTEAVDILTFLFRFVPYIGEKISRYLESNFSGYSHAGYMRYLTNIENGEFEKAELVYSVSFLRRIRAYLLRKMPFSSIPADHAISVYRKKLHFIAFKRNQ
ncbi:lipase [Halarcobacter ebronensis]|uniref:Lipase n=1 Tax=Halarcobacter ebronensis TaxID=1462615 RepID=A0A4Q0YHF0_9BACT|nr:lipase family protein [Halarcobacter ebronensis]RXJ68261.1 lipase [Halarcobacter ebronensis]